MSAPLTPTKPQQFDLIGKAFKEDPYPTFAEMRAQGPLARTKYPLLGPLWVTTTHAATLAVAKDSDLFVLQGEKVGKASMAGMQWWMPPSIKLLSNNMLSKDDPDHRRLRKLVDAAFARRGILDMRPQIAETTERLLDALPVDQEVDLVDTYARRLPLEVICDLLGLEGTPREKFANWSNKFAAVGGGFGILRAIMTLGSMIKVLRQVVETVRETRQPGLIAELVMAEEDGDRLSEDELIAMVFVLLVAGFETTTNLISGAILDLEQNPEQKAWLLAAPAERIEPAVEELLRHVSAVQGTKPRYVARDTDFFGVPLKKGELMMALPAAANADPEVFSAPETLQLDRFPNPHLAFSSGNHFCLGLQLARLEAQIALDRLYARYPDLVLVAPEAPVYGARPGVRTLLTLNARLAG